MADKKAANRGTEEKPAPGKARPWTDWKQTGTCEESQADGVPCDHTDGDCEICDRSALNPPAGSSSDS